MKLRCPTCGSDCTGIYQITPTVRGCKLCFRYRFTLIKPYIAFTAAELAKNSYKIAGSQRAFGLELELSSMHNGEALLEYSDKWGVKLDGTSGVYREIYSPPLQGDLGMLEILKFCRAARRYRWTVSSRCGFHLHVAVPEKHKMCNIALAYKYTKRLWYLWVAFARRTNLYCRSGSSDYLVSQLVNDKISLQKMISDCSGRYFWVNYSALAKFGTIEIRLHEGTVDWMTIKNWVKGHLRLIDWAVKVSPLTIKRRLAYTDLAQKFQNLCRIWNDETMFDFYAKKANQNYFFDLRQKSFKFAGPINALSSV